MRPYWPAPDPASALAFRSLRVLVLSADIGAGHDLPAARLRDAVLERRTDAEVDVLDTIAVAGPVAQGLLRAGLETVVERLPAVYDAQYALITRVRPTRAFGEALAHATCRRGLVAEVARRQPDVIVTTYPLATQVLGRLRAQGRLGVPLVAAITDLAALRWWAHPGCDAHLVIHPESAAEVRHYAGASARVEAVRGLSDPRFEAPARAPATARAALGLPPGAPVVVVSGGGWGVGDLAGAIEEALAASPDASLLVLCGTNSGVRERLWARFASVGRVRVLGFTDEMPTLLDAADVVVHSTAGLTVFEALLRGARVVSYGWGVGHISVNNRAYRALGLADVVEHRRGLAPAIRRALASPRRPDLSYGARPAAADLVLAHARDGA